jgi:RNA polymerase I-specific transcription initiation factor RRN3
VNRNESAVIRQHAIGYLSSLLSRAKFVTIEVVKKYIEVLSNYAHEYLKTCNSVNINLSPKAHLVFHSACQAIFYIIAFRSRGLDLANSQKNLMFLLSLNLSTIVKHPLNPLNYCLPAIVTIFDSIMTKYQIIYCHPILLKNASRKLAIIFSNEQHLPQDIIESVFPFDPFLLKKSGKKIHPIYIEYEPEEDELRVNVINTSVNKRTRNESECDDFIIPAKKSNTSQYYN